MAKHLQVTDKGIANGIAELDSNSKVPIAQLPASAGAGKVVDDITARNAILDADRYEGLRVDVLDASADATVTSGNAQYVLKSGLTNSDWEKTSESESLDIDLTKVKYFAIRQYYNTHYLDNFGIKYVQLDFDRA